MKTIVITSIAHKLELRAQARSVYQLVSQVGSLRAPRIPSDYDMLDSADPLSLTFKDLARIREAKSRATEGATELDVLSLTELSEVPLSERNLESKDLDSSSVV